MEVAKHLCPFCLYRGLYVRLDKKQRPMVQCGSCGLVAFPRNGELGVHALIATTELLEQTNAMTFVRTAAYDRATTPGSLASLLRPADGSLMAPEPEPERVKEAV